MAAVSPDRCRLLLIRHAAAGDRDAFAGPDDRRPLTGRGRRQAAGLVEALADFGADRILSSWYVRCLETVVPLAAERRLAIEPEEALVEGASLRSVAALMATLAGTRTILCTHGDVAWHALRWLAAQGVDAGGIDPPLAKGSTWLLGAEGGHWVSARYVPPQG